MLLCRPILLYKCHYLKHVHPSYPVTGIKHALVTEATRKSSPGVAWQSESAAHGILLQCSYELSLLRYELTGL